MFHFSELRGTGVLSTDAGTRVEVSYRLSISDTGAFEARGFVMAPIVVLSNAFMASNAQLRLDDGRELPIELTNYNVSGTAQIRTYCAC